MTARPDDTDPNARPTLDMSLEAQTDPSSALPEPSSREDVLLDRLLGGLREDSHFRPQPTQTATTAGQDFAAHVVAPHALAAGHLTDPTIAPVLLDITSPDGLPGAAVSPTRDDEMEGRRDAETGPALGRFAEAARRRRAAALLVLVVVVALAVGVLLVTWRAGSVAPAQGEVSTGPVAPATPPPLASAPTAAPTVLATAPATVAPSLSTIPTVSPSSSAAPTRAPAPVATVLPASSARRVSPPKEREDEIERTRK